MTEYKTVTTTTRCRFDRMRGQTRQVVGFWSSELPPMLADIKREAAEAQARYECARIDAYETFCRTLVPALIEAWRKVYGEPNFDTTVLTLEDRALDEITTKFPFGKFLPELAIPVGGLAL
jgi:hypothetical protein